MTNPTCKLTQAIATNLPTPNLCSADNQKIVWIKSSPTEEGEGPTDIKEMSCLNKTITKHSISHSKDPQVVITDYCC